MADGDVPICAHDEEEETACELVEAGEDQVGFAGDVAEDPGPLHDRHDEERYADEEELIGDGQIHYVHVRYGLHLGEPEHYIDDQSVAHQTDEADQGVEDLLENEDG